MKIEDVKKILSKITFGPSNLDMGWDWDVKETKIYDNGVLLEKGFSIRTTFMRPDINSGEIEKGYGRWMYVPENISSDGLVKTGWLCAELVVKHELMESFLYENKRIFDPHKSLEDLQYNARVSVSDGKKNNEMSEVEKEETISSEKLFHEQNIENHTSEITNFLDKNFKKYKNENEFIDKYKSDFSNIFHYLDKKGVVISDINSGRVLHSAYGENYTLSFVTDIINSMRGIDRVKTADPSDINLMISDRGFSDARSQEDFWIFSNPKNKTRYIVHSEVDKSVAIVDGNNDVIDVAEGDNYTVIKVESMFNRNL